MSGFDFTGILHAGDVVAWPQGPGEPTGLSGALIAQRHDLPAFSLLLGLGASRTVRPEHADKIALRALNGVGNNRSWTHLAEIIPVHISQTPGLIRSGALRVDIVLLRVRPHKTPGYFTTGVISDFTQALVEAARVVVAELDERLPLTADDALIPAEAIDHLVPAFGADILMPDPALSDVDQAIAQNVARLIPDGATIQLGVGSLPAAVAAALCTHRDLGVHSGVVTDALVDLIEAGVVTNARKGIDTGITVTGGLFGTERLRAHADGNAAIAMRACTYTHNQETLGRLHALHAINSAVEVDLSGQVNSEIAGGRYLGAVGGQLDFVRGAQRSAGGRSIIALPSTTADGKHSRIVASLDGRPVTCPRSDADIVVTEFGVADLRGCGLHERTRRLHAIAHPSFRDELLSPVMQAAQ
jgi:acetyl-CoA hydrolase